MFVSCREAILVNEQASSSIRRRAKDIGMNVASLSVVVA